MPTKRLLADVLAENLHGTRVMRDKYFELAKKLEAEAGRRIFYRETWVFFKSWYVPGPKLKQNIKNAIIYAHKSRLPVLQRLLLRKIACDEIWRNYELLMDRLEREPRIEYEELCSIGMSTSLQDYTKELLRVCGAVEAMTFFNEIAKMGYLPYNKEDLQRLPLPFPESSFAAIPNDPFRFGVLAGAFILKKYIRKIRFVARSCPYPKWKEGWPDDRVVT